MKKADQEERAVNLHIHQTSGSPAVFPIKNKSLLLRGYKLFWVTVKDFSLYRTTKPSKKVLKEHMHTIKGVFFVCLFICLLFLSILYNLGVFKSGLPKYLLFFCSWSPSVYNRILLEEKNLGELSSSAVGPANPFPWSFWMSHCQGLVKLASDTCCRLGSSMLPYQVHPRQKTT